MGIIPGVYTAQRLKYSLLLKVSTGSNRRKLDFSDRSRNDGDQEVLKVKRRTIE